MRLRSFGYPLSAVLPRQPPNAFRQAQGRPARGIVILYRAAVEGRRAPQVGDADRALGGVFRRTILKRKSDWARMGLSEPGY